VEKESLPSGTTECKVGDVCHKVSDRIQREDLSRAQKNFVLIGPFLQYSTTNENTLFLLLHIPDEHIHLHASVMTLLV